MKMQEYATEAEGLIDMGYLFPHAFPSAQGDLYRRENAKRNWVRLGVYLGFWRDADAHTPLIQKAQIRRMQIYAAVTHPEARCKCGDVKWSGVRSQYWAHWPSCFEYEALKTEYDRTHTAGFIAPTWSLPIDQ